MQNTFLIILLSIKLASFAQIKVEWPQEKLVGFKFLPASSFSNWEDFNKSVKLLQNEAFEKGYLEFSLDSLTTKDSISYQGYLHIGKQYAWKSIDLKNNGFKIPKNVQNGWNNSLITPTSLLNRIEKTIFYFQKNGYPFTKVHLDSIKLNKHHLTANLVVNPGKKVFWDTLNIIGDTKITKYYLENYLGIKKGKPYNEQIFRDIHKKLKELPFVTSTQKPSITFYQNLGTVNLHLKQKSANFINGVVGVLPNSSSTLTGDESQLVITGDLKLNLGNSFGYGEKIKINWKRIQAESQQLNTSEDIPFLFKSNIGLTHSLNLLKQDTSYINYANRVGVKYDLTAKRSFTAFWENETTNKLSNDPINNSNLSAANGSINAYGLKLFWDWLDYKFNPRKGILLNIEGKAGIKKMTGNKKDDKILIPLNESGDITSSLLVPETSMIYEGTIQIEGYIPLWKTISLKLANNSGFKSNPYLLDNDLYRLGGFSLLRGFDQQSIFTTNYSVFTSELRLLFEENSFFNLFWDQSLLNKSTLTELNTNNTTAFGAGINFQTKPGIFSLSYAVGKFNDTKLEFSSAKIHFGFINLF